MEEHEFVDLLRRVFRNLKSFRALYEDTGTSEVVGPNGLVLNLNDIERLYLHKGCLSPRQSQAIELFLYEDIREKDVAKLMGVSETNPVAIYATQGLKKLYRMVCEGEIEGYEDWVKPNGQVAKRY